MVAFRMPYLWSSLLSEDSMCLLVRSNVVWLPPREIDPRISGAVQAHLRKEGLHQGALWVINEPRSSQLVLMAADSAFFGTDEEGGRHPIPHQLSPWCKPTTFDRGPFVPTTSFMEAEDLKTRARSGRVGYEVLVYGLTSATVSFHYGRGMFNWDENEDYRQTFRSSWQMLWKNSVTWHMERFCFGRQEDLWRHTEPLDRVERCLRLN